MTQRESKKEYKQLSTEEREKIYLGLAQGISLAEIGRDKSCISREVRRNKKAGSGYLPDTADNLAYQRKFKCHHKIMHNPKLRDYIIAKSASAGAQKLSLAGFVQTRLKPLW